MLFLKLNKSLLLTVTFYVLLQSTFSVAADFELSDNLKDVTTDIIAELDGKIIVAGKKIQVTENNFWERGSKMNLPFSAVLSDAMAAALSDFGATVTTQEVGEEPWRLIGSYAQEGDDIAITVRLRLMGESASRDLAVSRGSVSESQIEQDWLEPDFSRVAKTLVRILDENYYGIRINVKSFNMEPRLKGQPHLRLEQVFPEYLQTAVAKSPLFEMSSFGATGVQSKMNVTYWKNGDENMTFHVEVADIANGKTLTAAEFSINIDLIHPEMLESMAVNEVSVCVKYKSSKDIKKDSSAAEALCEYVEEALAYHGIKVRTCGSGDDMIMAVVTMKFEKSEMSDIGYLFASGNVSINIKDANGKKIGNISKKKAGKILKDDADIENEANRIVNELYDDETLSDELAGIILGRK